MFFNAPFTNDGGAVVGNAIGTKEDAVRITGSIRVSLFSLFYFEWLTLRVELWLGCFRLGCRGETKAKAKAIILDYGKMSRTCRRKCGKLVETSTFVSDARRVIH